MTTVHPSVVSVFLAVLIASVHVSIVHTFVKLLPVGTKVEFESKVNNIIVAHTFHGADTLTNQSIDMDIVLTRPVKDAKLEAAYYNVVGNGSSQQLIVKRTVNVCTFFRNINTDRLLKVLFHYLIQRTNLPMRCPFPVGKYYMNDIRPSDVPVPAFLPEAAFKLELVYRSEVRRKTLIEFIFHGKLMRFIDNVFVDVM